MIKNDYIKRKDIYDHIFALYKTADICGFVVTGDMVLKSIEYAVAEDVKSVVHGKWIVSRSWNKTKIPSHCKCSICGYEVSYIEKKNFCPNCGAEMENWNE